MHNWSIHPSIYLFSAADLKSVCSGSRVNKVAQQCFRTPGNLRQSLAWWDIFILLLMYFLSWVYPRVFYQLDVPGTPPVEGAQEASNSDAWTTSTGCFQHKRTIALLWAPHNCQSSLSSLRLTPATSQRIRISPTYSQNLIFPFITLRW